ncbi:hypothetical protein H9P43_006471 [Blastocladiella emersonii ATCC 22665]|nr:hypothetical protein H9P43_006471 [Blastocladiella emersonii ATCC 22665]
MDDTAALVGLLERLCSQDAGVLRDAEAALKRAEAVPGFHARLQAVFFQRDAVSPTARWMAVRCLRAGIERHWRRGPRGCIGHDEKAAIRARALDMLHEPDRAMLAQVAVAIAKMARLDFPAEWPSVLADLFALIESPATPGDLRERALIALHHVVKALVSVKIGASRKHVAEIAPHVLDGIVALFAECAAQPGDLHRLNTALYAVKCIRKLLVFATPDVAASNSAAAFLANLSTYLGAYYAAGHAKIVTNLGKLAIDLQEYRGLPWLTYPGTPALVQWYSQAVAAKSDAIPEKVLLQALHVLKQLIRFTGQFTVQEATGTLHPSSPDEAPAQWAALRAMVTPDFARGLTAVLVEHYLRFSDADVRAIHAEPYAWVLDEDNDHWEYRVRGCAARLVMDLILNYEAAVVPSVLAMLQAVTSMQLAGDARAMLAVLTAVNDSADRLHRLVPFAPLFTEFLMPWARRALGPEAPLVARTVCLAIAAFINNTPKTARPAVYEALARELLVPAQHPVVQLAAVDALRFCVDEWELVVEDIAPYMPALMEQLLRLLGALDEFDLKTKVVNCISVIIERFDTQVAAFAPAVAEFVPSLWDEAQDEPLFQATLLVMLRKLAVSLRGHSVHLQPIAVPLLGVACVAGSPAALYLLEDALLLWHSLLQHAQTLGDLGALLPLVPPLMETGSESLRTVLGIVQSYLFLDARSTMASIGAPAMAQLLQLLGGVPDAQARAGGLAPMRPQASAIVTRVLETFLITGGADALNLMAQSQVVPRLVHGLVSKHDHTLALVAFVAVLARAVAITDPSQFVSLVGGPDVFAALFPVWLDLWDHIGHPSQRKLSALALTRLVPLSPQHLVAVAAVWTEILHEVSENEAGDAPLYWRMEASDYGLEDDEEAAEATRRRDVMRSDAVHAVSLAAYIREQIGVLAAQLGGMNALTAVLPAELVEELAPLLGTSNSKSS